MPTSDSRFKPGADLSGVSLPGEDLTGVNLAGADLSGADLQRAELRDANLEDANLEDANLNGARLTRANLAGARLTNADLESGQLQGASLSGALLGGADLRRAQISNADLDGANLHDANLNASVLFGSSLVGASLQMANLTVADLRGADCRDADFGLADLRGAYLSGADFFGADLAYAVLSVLPGRDGKADLRGDLRGALFLDTDLTGDAWLWGMTDSDGEVVEVESDEEPQKSCKNAELDLDFAKLRLSWHERLGWTTLVLSDAEKKCSFSFSPQDFIYFAHFLRQAIESSPAGTTEHLEESGYNVTVSPRPPSFMLTIEPTADGRDRAEVELEGETFRDLHYLVARILWGDMAERV